MATREMVRRIVPMALVALMSPLAACVPDAPPPTLLDVTTQLTWCGGVIPPPGEPACHTSSRPATLEIRGQRAVLATGTSGADGHLVVEVPAGVLLTVVATGEPAYEQCDHPTVVAVAASTTPVVQTCTVFAP